MYLPLVCVCSFLKCCIRIRHKKTTVQENAHAVSTCKCLVRSLDHTFCRFVALVPRTYSRGELLAVDQELFDKLSKQDILNLSSVKEAIHDTYHS
jgi:hypothetical protein